MRGGRTSLNQFVLAHLSQISLIEELREGKINSFLYFLIITLMKQQTFFFQEFFYYYYFIE